ncbi:Proline/betaine transporter [Andreprevotia sp. IGB-42]|uniref:MFS transporter n=1 Tax=Andreprevotia sp. IGB-42 TaxID=2497473 RepID=UPI001356F949|nr:MFS transporter [Andreprevotia sp. IGB-42]KAF0814464.1 Proline/betaine transporter [Andreprevotia sp. IGB-42]
MTTEFTDAELHRPLNRNDYKTLSLSALGGALEFYDFVIFVFFVAVLGHLFFPPDMPEWLRQTQAFGIFAAGYLARPLGGIIIAHYGDKLGRKKMFTLSIFLMAVPTLAIGLLPTYESIGIAAPLLLLLFRILQGAAIGGEVPGAWVFVSEHVPGSKTGLAVGTLTAGLTFGILLGSLVAVIINKQYTQEEITAWAWRIPFILGGVFGLLAVYLRRFLQETPIFKELHARKALAEGLPLAPILRNHLGSVVVSMLLTWVLSAAIVVVILLTPNYLQKIHHILPVLASEANVLATLTLTLGCVVFGWATDRFGARNTMLVGYTGLLASSYLFYSGLPGSPEHLMATYALTGFFVGAIATVPYVAVRAFPAAVRFSGLSFSYNVAYAIFGGLTPVFLSWWVSKEPHAPAYYVGALAILGFALAFTSHAANQPAGKTSGALGSTTV